MPIWVHFEFLWIPHRFGGHIRPPFENMMTLMGWQEYGDSPNGEARTIRWVEFDYDETTREGYARCQFLTDTPLPDGWLKPGLLLELVFGGNRIIAIGRIVENRIPEIKPE
ncbi:hypothetical protein [Herpetosiphon giganteus]|uniref:hypothetical protein n=1 Tax=Herpetosiphon giganteus TaxID=2029754 RepID=UPI001959499E|nr:hypothetical protein [Herpetosiphon giganteus]MBM7843552.1 hypothetical protein [Herpetosiphon giganteus]